ncbi:cytochrome P450 [Mycena epipterygia]|nr:cytochrome P450 [Mycena epipterygia]
MDARDALLLLAYGLVAAKTISWMWHRQNQPVPALVGSNGVLSSYAGAFQFLVNAGDLVGRGYTENREAVFRVPHFWRWDYLANGPKRAAEIAAASDDVLSFQHGAEELLQGDYTMGPEITANPYHQYTIRTGLTKNLGRCLPQMHDEVVCALDGLLGLEGTDWKEITVLPTMTQVVARTSSRMFVGLPLCRNKEYVDLVISYAISVFGRASIISLIPSILKPIFGRLLSSRRSAVRHAMKFLGPVIQERLAKEAELGMDWPDKPNDLISWLLEDAQGKERTAPAITLRVLVTNTVAIHTSSMALTSALYNLTTFPSHIASMREEAERVVAVDGWTKSALANMHKIDSFLRESLRMTPLSLVSMRRKIIGKDGFTFSDGTFIPSGSFLSVSTAVHYDSTNYDNPEVFDGFRFSREREAQEKDAGESVFKHNMVSTSADHLAFGFGKHSCPGRFFAAAELKLIMAYILINYEVKAQKEGVRPPDFSFGLGRGPSMTGKIWIRKRLT